MKDHRSNAHPIKVVRCKDCIHRLNEGTDRNVCGLDVPIFDVNGFCSEGAEGEWEYGFEFGHNGKALKPTRVFRFCSECLFERDDCDRNKDTLYCPNCGAKMSRSIIEE